MLDSIFLMIEIDNYEFMDIGEYLKKLMDQNEMKYFGEDKGENVVNSVESGLNVG